MFYRKQLMMLVALVLLVFSVSACTVGAGVQVPDRDISISLEDALEAQNMAVTGMMMGGVELTEAQFSSLLTELLKANSGENNPVTSIKAWFEPDTIYLQVNLKEGVLPAAFGTTLNLVGSVDVVDNHLAITVREASAGPYAVSGAMLAPVNAQLNAALANYQLLMPVDVSLDTGVLSVSMGQ